ncbi:isoaspartyl peptidase/L-asparaginase family protein [Brevundimonas sp.]|uniref:isoaspartyl peptidase/L-asparaginase family protein n=1 Tax=Brevundimonas sp. TaxID=1871086 RepID=UPI0035B416AF
MKSVATALALALIAAPAVAQDGALRWSLAIHGGAGVIERSDLSPEQDAAYRAALSRALEAGAEILRNGGSALDAVQAAIEPMEDDPLFNAGRGAVFTAAGRNELDAAIMDGATLNAGAVAGLTRTRHPVAAARAVMEQSPHVFLIGEGADVFSAEQDLEQVEPAWFFTERRWQGLVRALTEAGLPIPERPEGAPAEGEDRADLPAPPLNERKFGTVGAVALDATGNLAAATSTGGMTMKRWGRVGDVPVIGAGTYASNAEGCAVSATGSGEYFIRATVARDICARIGRLNERTKEEEWDLVRNSCPDPTPDEICMAHLIRNDVLAARAEMEEVGELGGDGGVIVMSARNGHWFEMNTSGMYRGAVSSEREAEVAIYADEE